MFVVRWWQPSLGVKGTFQIGCIDLEDAKEEAKELSRDLSGFFKIHEEGWSDTTPGKVVATACNGGVIDGDEEFDEA